LALTYTFVPSPRIAKFADDPARTASLDRWKLLREEWVKSEKPARAAMKIFETFYTLHGRIDREAERVELVLGDGILSWRRTEGGIYHPILLQRLNCSSTHPYQNSRFPKPTIPLNSIPHCSSR